MSIVSTLPEPSHINYTLIVIHLCEFDLGSARVESVGTEEIAPTRIEKI